MEKSSKNFISLFREKPARRLPKPPPHPPLREFKESIRGKCVSAMRGHDFHSRTWGAEKGGGGGTRNYAIR